MFFILRLLLKKNKAHSQPLYNPYNLFLKYERMEKHQAKKTDCK